MPLRDVAAWPSKGILPDRMIAALAQAARSCPRTTSLPDQIQPASLDLRLGDDRLSRARELPARADATVAERIDDLKLHEIELTNGAVLETGCVYIVPLMESLALPADIAAAANPKSSTGRLDVFTRVIADRDPRLRPHRAPAITVRSMPRSAPSTFPVLVREGSRLSQIRFRRGHARARRRRALARVARARAAGRSATTPMSSDGIVGRASTCSGSAGNALDRLSRQAPHRPDRCRAPRRLRRRRFLGADAGARGRQR